MSGEDIRRVVGAKVYAKAFHDTSLAKCSRRYGLRAKTKRVCRMVLEIVNNKTSLNRNSCFVLVESGLGGGTRKRKELNTHSVLKVTQDLDIF